MIFVCVFISIHFSEISLSFSCLLKHLSSFLGEHVQLRLKIGALASGIYQVPIMITDSGHLPMSKKSFLKVKVCPCDHHGDCVDMERIMAMGLGTGAIIGILLCIILLLGKSVLMTWIKKKNKNIINPYRSETPSDQNAVLLMGVTKSC